MDILELTNDREKREALKEYVSESIKLLKEIDRLIDEKKAIGNSAKDSLGISQKDFNNIVKHTYKSEIEEEINYLSEIEEVIRHIGG